MPDDTTAPEQDNPDAVTDAIATEEITTEAEGDEDTGHGIAVDAAGNAVE